jgi:hydrogenase/urease accessory protein HupE
VEHIVLGADHVLFLVTIIVAGAGWRYWLAVLTSFTLAHSITLTLGLLGWVKVNPAVVEPLIAASIVLMALLNLFNLIRHNGQATSTARQTAVVFACGLLHGLGFASSMADMGLHGNYQLASLLGFNLGIELGQALCLVVVLACVARCHMGNRCIYPTHAAGARAGIASGHGGGQLLGT